MSRIDDLERSRSPCPGRALHRIEVDRSAGGGLPGGPGGVTGRTSPSKLNLQPAVSVDGDRLGCGCLELRPRSHQRGKLLWRVDLRRGDDALRRVAGVAGDVADR